MGATGSDGILVANAGEDVPPSSTGLTHEIGHWAFGDDEHSCRLGTDCLAPLWGEDPNQDYEPGTRIGDENLALANLGM